MLAALQADGFLLRHGQDSDGEWSAVFGGDERGLLFGTGKLLHLIDFERQQARVPAGKLNGSNLLPSPRRNASVRVGVQGYMPFIARGLLPGAFTD